MAMRTGTDEAARPPLSRERVLRAAVELADEAGLNALSMRKLGGRLGVEAMSLYHHVADKDDLLDGMVDLVFEEFEVPADAPDWRAALRRRAESARAALGRHPWAVGLLDSRTSPGPATLRHHDAVLGCLRRAGFPVAMAGHAFSLLDSYIYGFVLQEQSLPFDAATSERLDEVAGGILAAMPEGAYPHLAEMAMHTLREGYAYADEFAFGLALILDGLERAREAS